jgi:hypothetical protein
MTAAQRLAAIRDVLRDKDHHQPEQVILDIEALLSGWQ